VRRHCGKLGVADETYDAIVSSGDLARHFVADHPDGRCSARPERDNRSTVASTVLLAPLEQADYIVCTACSTTKPNPPKRLSRDDDAGARAQADAGLRNPDIVVERGDRLIYCAGAIRRNS